jgi:hypothetical protein
MFVIHTTFKDTVHALFIIVFYQQNHLSFLISEKTRLVLDFIFQHKKKQKKTIESLIIENDLEKIPSNDNKTNGIR